MMLPLFSPVHISMILRNLKKDLNFSCLLNPKSPPPLAYRSFSTSEISLPSPLLLLTPENSVKRDTAVNQYSVTFLLFNPAENKFLKPMKRRLPKEISKARCIVSSRSWLGFDNHRYPEFFLANILSSNVVPEIVPLPSVRKEPRLMRFETLEHYQRFIFNRKWNQNFNRKLKQHFNTDKELEIPLVVHKMAISSPSKDGKCTIMIICNHNNELAFCRIGDSSWTCLGNQFVISSDDIIYSKKHQLFYAINGVGYVQAWDLKNPSFPISKEIKYTYSQGSLEPPKEISRVKFSRCRYLVELPQGDILTVIRYQSSIREDGSLFSPESFDLRDRFPSKTVWFDLGKIDFEKQTLEPVDCLGDAVVFLGANESFSVSAEDYPGLRPNCIYFSNDPPAYYRYIGKPYGGCDTGVFSLEDHSISPGYPFELGKSQPPPIWIFPRP